MKRASPGALAPNLRISGPWRLVAAGLDWNHTSRGDPMSFAGRIRVALLFTLGLLGPVHVSGAAAAPAAAPGSRAGVPMTLSVGVTEDVSSLMRRQALLNATGGVLRDAERDVEQPDRSSLPQNPASPLSASTGGSPAGLGPIRDLGPFTPQTIGTSFTAATLSGTNPTLSFPPDCMGAVGPTQMVVFVNGRLVTFNKTTGVADGVLNLNPDVFFVSVRNGSSTSDPRIRYDRLTGRWFLVIINVSTPNRILIAVSDAASAGVISGSTVFTYFFINIATLPPTISSTCLADYPTLGVDANALYIGTNNFCGSPIQSFNSTDGYVIRKSSILGAGPMVVTVFRGLVATSGSTGPYTPQGVDNFDPAATEGYFIGVDNLSYGLLQMRRVSSPGGTPAISANVPITVSATSAPLRVPHLGNTGGANGQLSALDDRLFAAHIRGGKLWTAHNIGVNNTGVASGTITRDGSRWYQLTVPPVSGTPTVTQSGTVYTATATNLTTERFYWIPSVMVSGQGHVAMGLSTSGSNERANSAALGRFPGDPAGTMQAATLFSSSATAYNPPSDPGGSNGRRWGDYSYTSVDPLDDQTMWTVQMFCDATNSYGVRVAKLVPPPPATPATVADVTAGQNPVTVTLTGTSVTGSSFFDPGPDLPGVPAFHHLSASISNTGVTGTPPTVVSATYVDSVTVSLVLNASAATANLVGEKYTVTVTNPDGQTAAAAVLRVVAPAAPTVSVTSPVGGETWAMGSSHNITWTASSGAAITGVDLAYSTDGGATYPNVIATGLANSGSYAWTVPSVATSTARVRATAHDANSQSGSGSSPADFTIADQSAPSVSISSPLGGEVWGMASSHNITWTATDNVGVVAVDLAYSTDGGSTYPNVIATGLANSGSYAWTVPSIASTTLRVRVTAADAAANSASAASPGNFTVADQTVPSVAVTAPVGGETWAMGSSRNITWTATDNV
ncbi:MAG: hypothetical protein HZB25_11635, partial [Candidatus Eisenbacteria bacterium]|nr:hypothetical protein [Candidatus Eisenbacteria bacterium]